MSVRAGVRSCLALAAACVFLDFAAAAEIPPAERRSGYDLMGRETRAMQDDDAGNPGMLWVLDGEALWNKKAGAADRACAACHGDARASMKGVAARHPAFDAALRRPVNLEQRINICRTERQKAVPLAFESKELLALTAYVARQSRGLPINIAIDARSKPFLDAGSEAFHRRQGQLNLEAHPTGYPLYRLEWQGLGSLERRLRNCLIGIRAEPYAYGAPEFVDLELYLMWRANGMKIETPAVRP